MLIFMLFKECLFNYLSVSCYPECIFSHVFMSHFPTTAVIFTENLTEYILQCRKKYVRVNCSEILSLWLQ